MAEQATARITMDTGEGEPYTIERSPNGCYRVIVGSTGITWTVANDSPSGAHYQALFTNMEVWRDRTKNIAKALNGNGDQPEPAVLDA